MKCTSLLSSDSCLRFLFSGAGLRIVGGGAGERGGVVSGEEAGIVANSSAVCCGGASMIGVFGVTDDLSASWDPPPLIGVLLMAMLP